MNETKVTYQMTRPRLSPLCTDGYKFSMGQAGFPLREETFYLSFRKGGPHYIPFDLVKMVEDLAYHPDVLGGATWSETRFLARHGYQMTGAMEQALYEGKVKVWAAPKGSWVNDSEPILTITGPSFKVSWLEPLVIMFNFHIQIATFLMNLKTGGPGEFQASCESEANIIKLVAKEMGKPEPNIEVLPENYRELVTARVEHVVEALGGDAYRAFEVGMRGVTCMEQHLKALKSCRDAGISQTSNVYLAWLIKNMTPIGTTGHEHQQRWGNDEDGFRAIRDMRPQAPSYLFDTYDVFHSGIPQALRVMAEDPDRKCSVRFDSGDQDAQLKMFLDFESDLGISPRFIFEDGYNDRKTQQNEYECERAGVATNRRFYGYGGHFVYFSNFSRNRVSAVYKLCQTGTRPVMKFGKGKASIPGKPVILRNVQGGSMIAQEGETVEGFLPIMTGDIPKDKETLHSPLTEEFTLHCARRVER